MLKLPFFILSNPSLWFSVAKACFLRPMRTRLRLLLGGMYHPRYYPAEIYKSWVKINRSRDLPAMERDWSSVFQDPKISKNTLYQISLAGEEIDSRLISGFWKQSEGRLSQDPEVEYAAHRFHWAVVKLASGVTAEFVRHVYHLIDEWISIFQVKPGSVPWQPYTLSERLCNWIVILQVGQKIEAPDKEFVCNLTQAITNHLLVLSDHLEYPASGHVNNHILNNGRALYIGGRYVGREDFAELGREIFRNHLSDLIGGSGFLLEASSHYQFLLTRSVFEMQIVAHETNDMAFSFWINEVLQRMLSASDFLVPSKFLEPCDMPRIGDVSPDVPFDWFDPREGAERRGWRALWKFSKVEMLDCSLNQEGWLKICSNQWSAIAYSHPDRSGYPIGHGHDDFGSALLFYAGVPVIVDIGRFNYSREPTCELLGAEAGAHSTVLVNGKPILFSGRGYASLKSSASRRNAECYLSENGRGILWSAIVQGGVQWQRSLTIEKNGGARILDVVEAGCEAEIDGFLYLALGLKPSSDDKSCFLLEGFGHTFEIKVEGADMVESEKVPFFPSYGIRSEIYRLHWSCSVLGKRFVSISIVKVEKSKKENV
jgi:hypothetical protein